MSHNRVTKTGPLNPELQAVTRSQPFLVSSQSKSACRHWSPRLASTNHPLWDACALVQLIRPVIQREATQDTAAFVAPRSMGFVLLAAGWSVGLMLWFMQNRFVGSYLFFRVTRRSKLAP
jgi:hypothetical protein